MRRKEKSEDQARGRRASKRASCVEHTSQTSTHNRARLRCENRVRGAEVGEHAVAQPRYERYRAAASGGSRATTFRTGIEMARACRDARRVRNGPGTVRGHVLTIVRGGCGVCSRETLSVGLTACGGRSAVRLAVRVHPNTEKRGREGSGAPCDLPCRCVFLRSISC